MSSVFPGAMAAGTGVVGEGGTSFICAILDDLARPTGRACGRAYDHDMVFAVFADTVVGQCRDFIGLICQEKFFV